MSQPVTGDGLAHNGLVLCNNYIPEELILNILSFVEPRTLVECRTVCRFWKSLIDNQVWRLKVVNEHCRSLKDAIRVNTSQISWQDLYGVCNKLPLGRNLVQNSCGQDELTKWTILSSGGNRWAVEKTPNGADPIPEQSYFRQTSCFATSYHSCSKKQTIDLAAEGLTSGFMDIIQPTIEISEWYAGRFDCGCVYEIEVSLLDKNRELITDFRFRETIEQWEGRAWKQVSHLFESYGPGVRFVDFYHGGMDTQFWAGHYGSKMTGARVIVDW